MNIHKTKKKHEKYIYLTAARKNRAENKKKSGLKILAVPLFRKNFEREIFFATSDTTFGLAHGKIHQTTDGMKYKVEEKKYVQPSRCGHNRTPFAVSMDEKKVFEYILHLLCKSVKRQNCYYTR